MASHSLAALWLLLAVVGSLPSAARALSSLVPLTPDGDALGGRRPRAAAALLTEEEVAPARGPASNGSAVAPPAKSPRAAQAPQKVHLVQLLATAAGRSSMQGELAHDGLRLQLLQRGLADGVLPIILIVLLPALAIICFFLVARNDAPAASLLEVPSARASEDSDEAKLSQVSLPPAQSVASAGRFGSIMGYLGGMTWGREGSARSGSTRGSVSDFQVLAPSFVIRSQGTHFLLQGFIVPFPQEASAEVLRPTSSTTKSEVLKIHLSETGSESGILLELPLGSQPVAFLNTAEARVPDRNSRRVYIHNCLDAHFTAKQVPFASVQPDPRGFAVRRVHSDRSRSPPIYYVVLGGHSADYAQITNDKGALCGTMSNRDQADKNCRVLSFAEGADSLMIVTALLAAIKLS